MTSRFDWLNGDVPVLRAGYERERAKPIPVGARWATFETVRVLEHQASGPSDTVIVYFHGGGFIVGSPLTHADITSVLCRQAGLPLYSVDYRLAPEFVAPAPVEDGIAVVRHLLASGVTTIILCGDSAGGAIALAVEADLPDALRPHIAGVCSFYGAFGIVDTASLIEKGSRADGTDQDCVKRYFSLANGSLTQNIYSVAALARPSPVPIYLLAAGDDPLRDDSLLLGEAAKACGRAVMLDLVERETHGFLHDAGTSAAALDALARASRWFSSLSKAPG